MPHAWRRDFTTALDKLPRGASGISDFSIYFDEAIKQAWTYATLLYGESQVRTGHVLLAMMKTAQLQSILMQMSREFAKVKVEDLTDNFRSSSAARPRKTRRQGRHASRRRRRGRGGRQHQRNSRGEAGGAR